MIKTIIRPQKLEEVQEALNELRVSGLTISEVLGRGEGAVGDGIIVITPIAGSYHIRTGDWSG